MTATKTFRLYIGLMVSSVAVGFVARLLSRWMGADDSWRTVVAVALLTLMPLFGLSWLLYHFYQQWQTAQQQADTTLAEGITIAMLPRSATLPDPKLVEFWRRLAVVLTREGELPSQHISFELVGQRERVLFLARIPKAWLRTFSGHIQREFPETEIQLIAEGNQQMKGMLADPLASVRQNNKRDEQTNARSPILHPPKDERQRCAQSQITTLKPSTYPLFIGDKPIIGAMLSAVNATHPQATVGYQFLIRGALPQTQAGWEREANRLHPPPKPNQPTPKVSKTDRLLAEAMRTRATDPAFEVQIWVWAMAPEQALAQRELKRVAQALVSETITSGLYNQLVMGQIHAGTSALAYRAWDRGLRLAQTAPNGVYAPTLLSATELGQLLSLPGKQVAETCPKLLTASAKKLPPSADLVVKKGRGKCILGHFRHPTGDVDAIGIPYKETRKHRLTIAPTGSGKSVQMINSIHSDLTEGAGVLMIEPSGTVSAMLADTLTPEQMRRTVLFNPRDRQPFALNMCAVGLDLGLETAVQNTLGAIKMAMGANWETAVRMQQLLTYSLYVVMDVLNRGEGAASQVAASLVALEKFLNSEAYREELLPQTSLQAMAAKNFWENDFANWNEREQKDSVSVVNRRLAAWLGAPAIRRTLALPLTTFNLSHLLGSPLNETTHTPHLVLLPLHPRMGADTKALIGSLFVNAYMSALFLRDRIPEDQRRTASLHIDEFKNFVGSSGGQDIEILLAEGRKYGAAVSLYAQGQRQIAPSVRTETDINTLTKVFYALPDPQEARLAKEQLAGVVDVYDVQQIPDYHAYVKVGQSPPTLIQMLPPAMAQREAIPLKQGFRQKPQAEWKALVLGQRPFNYLHPSPMQPPSGVAPRLSDLTAPDLLQWAQRQADDGETLVRQLTTLSDEDFNALRQTRQQFDQWRAEELLHNPALIADALERIQCLTRWQYGIPDWESDALYFRLAGVGQQKEAETDLFGGWEL